MDDFGRRSDVIHHRSTSFNVARRPLRSSGNVVGRLWVTFGNFGRRWMLSGVVGRLWIDFRRLWLISDVVR